MPYRRMAIAITAIGTLEKLQRRRRSEAFGVAKIGIKIVKRKRKEIEIERRRGKENCNTTAIVREIDQETSGETMTDRATLLE